MKILLLDSRNLYNKNFVKELDKSWKVDIVTEGILGKFPENIHVIKGSRRDPFVYKEIAHFYDVILDADCLVIEDMESVIESIETKKYILLSTTQIYRFLEDKVHKEEEISKEYLNQINSEYIDYNVEPEKFYIKEKMNIEFKLCDLCKAKGINYFILRLSKCYFKQDLYKDIAWIVHHLNAGKRIFMNESNFMEIGSFHPLYEQDLYQVLIEIICDTRGENRVLNVGQNQVVSLITMTKIIATILYRSEFFHIVFVPEHDSEQSRQIKVPCNKLLLADNSKLLESYEITFTETKKWVETICDAVLKKEKRSVVQREEKIVEDEFKKYCSFVRLRLEKDKNALEQDKQGKGKIVKFYENI